MSCKILIAAALAGLAGQPSLPAQSISKHTAHLRQHVLLYRNTQYGFTFVLPRGWKGYWIVRGTWRGFTTGEHGDETVEHGPVISIRHPEWTAEHERQDIPITVFTRSQWRALHHDRFVVYAAPIGPGEIGRNRKYIFAIGPREINDSVDGSDEVFAILRRNPLRAFNLSAPALNRPPKQK